MHLPTNIKELFTQLYEGAPSVKLRSASETIMVENALKRAHLSYQTKISRTKKHGREFIVVLMEPADGTT
jgi:hypothetical protein